MEITHESIKAIITNSLVKVAEGIAGWLVMRPFVFRSGFWEGYA